MNLGKFEHSDVSFNLEYLKIDRNNGDEIYFESFQDGYLNIPRENETITAGCVNNTYFLT